MQTRRKKIKFNCLLPLCNKEFWGYKSQKRKFCSLQCSGHYYGLKRKENGHTWGHKISEAKKGVPRHNMRGKNNPNWQGGKTKLRIIDMARVEYKNWRESVFIRDDYTCQGCGTRGGYLQADHIKEYHKYPELRYNIDNGRTLCLKCHFETFSYAIPFNGSTKSVNQVAKLIGRSRKYVYNHFVRDCGQSI